MATTDTDYETGDRVYYTGDMANASGFGVIIKKRPADRFAPVSYDIHLDDERVFKGVYHLSFETSPGRRFWLKSEWDADRKLKMDAFLARYKETVTSREGN